MLASVASMIDQFNMINISTLRQLGYEVSIAANFEYGNTASTERVNEFRKELTELNILYYNIDFSRNITNIIDNIRAYKQIKALMEKNKYTFIHCHSPIGGFCGRVAGCSTKTTVLYTAHGFHFYKGAPLINWLLYYPIEWWLATYSDVLITINKEDYNRAMKFKANSVKYIPGIGIDTRKYIDLNIDKLVKRKELGLPVNAFILLSVGELNKNKNHETAIRAIKKLNNDKLHYVICGTGPLENYLKKLIASLGLERQVTLLGFRKDVNEIYFIADEFIFPSFREGLSVALMEAMAAGLPVVCSKIRGNIDLIDEGKGGYLCEPDCIKEFSKKIEKLMLDNETRRSMGRRNIEEIKKYDKELIKIEMKRLYKVYL